MSLVSVQQKIRGNFLNRLLRLQNWPKYSIFCHNISYGVNYMAAELKINYYLENMNELIRILIYYLFVVAIAFLN